MIAEAHNVRYPAPASCESGKTNRRGSQGVDLRMDAITEVASDFILVLEATVVAKFVVSGPAPATVDLLDRLAAVLAIIGAG